MSKFISIIMLMLTITGCSSASSTAVSNKGSYPSAIVWHDTLYGVSAYEVASKDIGKELGEIKQIVVPMPKNNGDSNDKLGKLYELKSKQNFEVLALESNGHYFEVHILGPLNH
ncbi:hypothetical protein QFZ81_002988 [Paenibacillus sp. V4I9]|uniref:hypothetical protein n=1 Tax=Paenibacillus sp. V4I9 TaxID=3042308 RepID=UPI00278B0DD9|nr:hypothetical protein [Paenibacillus sp. V4I9]MDQ0887900.1 hypothetical protein [Paenibacillus sp. V4I9]